MARAATSTTARLTAEGRYYQSLGNRAVVAVRARAAARSIDRGPRSQLVPFFKRYFLGGSTNLRGWGRFEVSPLSAIGLPIGGQSFIELLDRAARADRRQLRRRRLPRRRQRLANPWDFNLNDMRYDVGPGLRYNTPIGPVRLDVG